MIAFGDWRLICIFSESLWMDGEKENDKSIEY